MEFRFPWESEQAQIELYHHLTISGPAAQVAEFAAAARGSGVMRWQLDFGLIEEDLFNLAASHSAARRSLTTAGCRILARQFHERIEVRPAKASAFVGRNRACPFDLQGAAAGAVRHPPAWPDPSRFPGVAVRALGSLTQSYVKRHAMVRKSVESRCLCWFSFPQSNLTILRCVPGKNIRPATPCQGRRSIRAACCVPKTLELGTTGYQPAMRGTPGKTCSSTVS